MRFRGSDTSAVPVPHNLLITSPSIINGVNQKVHKTGKRDYANNTEGSNYVNFKREGGHTRNGIDLRIENKNGAKVWCKKYRKPSRAPTACVGYQQSRDNLHQ